MELPDELSELLEEFKEIGKEVFDSEAIDLGIELQDFYMGLIREVATSGGRQVIEIGTGLLVKSLIKKFSDPDQIQELMADHILPAIYEEMTRVFAKQVLSSNHKQFSVLFSHLSNFPNEKEYTLDKVYKQLFNLTKKEFSTSAIKKDLDYNTFKKTVAPIIEKTAHILTEIRKEKKDGDLSDLEADAVLKRILQDEDHGKERLEAEETNPIYAEAINNILFGLGEFGKGTEFILNRKVVKKAYNQFFLKHLHDFRSSPPHADRQSLQ